MIERVEKFATELQSQRLTASDRECGILHRAQIEVVYPGARNHAVAGVSENAEQVVGETTGVEPAIESAGAAVEVAIANAIGPIQVLPAYIGRHSRCWRQRKSGVRR